jgi:hypothetical protein
MLRVIQDSAVIFVDDDDGGSALFEPIPSGAAGSWTLQVGRQLARSDDRGVDYFLLTAISEPVVPCGATGDGAVSQTDVDRIRSERGGPLSSAEDPRDTNRDGSITNADVNTCVPLCTVGTCTGSPDAFGGPS